MTNAAAKPTSLMGTNAYRNSNYDADAKQAEDLLKANDSQGLENTATSNEQKPEHDWEKRYKDLQSYHSKTVNQLKNDNTTLANQATPRFVPPKTPEDMARFKADKPEEYAFIQSIAHGIANDLTKSVQAELDTVSTDLRDNKIEKAAFAIEAAHPDWATLRESQDFHEWGTKQDATVQGWLYDNPDNAQDAIRAISLYKADRNALQSQSNTNQSNTLDASTSVNVQGQNGQTLETDRNSPGYMWKDSEIAKMRPEEYAKWHEVIQLAYREGRYIQGQ